MEMLSVLTTTAVGTALLAVASYMFLLQPAQQHVWSQADSPFYGLQERWGKAFLFAGGAGLLGALTVAATTGNAGFGITFGLLLAFVGVMSWTDLSTFKVPTDLSGAAMLVMFLMGVVTLVANPFHVPFSETFSPVLQIPTVSVGDLLPWLLITGVVTVLFGALFMVGPGRIAIAALALAWVAAFLFIYGLITSVTTMDVPIEAKEIALRAALAFVFIGVIVLFDILLVSGIGGGDIRIMYAVGFGLGWWVGPYLLFISLLVAFALQIIVHLLAKPLDLGYKREVKNGLIRQGITNARWKRAKKEGSAPKTHLAHAVPFVPMLAAGVAGTVLVFTSIYG